MDDNPQVLQREAFSRSASVHRIEVAAGGVFPIFQYGQTFYLLRCTAPVEIKTNLTPEKPYRKGTGEIFVEELRFDRVEIRNPNAFTVRVDIWIGFGRYIDSRIEVQENYTQLASAAETVGVYSGGILSASATLVLNGAPAGAQIQRKAIVVSNLDPTTVLQVLDENNKLCCAVFPSTSVTLPISGPCKVKNPTGIVVAAYISELWYVENSA